MPNVANSTLTDPNLPEPKGASAASAGQVYVANGAASGTWRYLPHSYCYYTNIGTGTTYTAPTSMTLLNPVTTGDSNPRDFTHNSAGRLTYTGATTLDVTVTVTITLKHSGAATDVQFQVFKNGVAVTGTKHVATANSSTYENVTMVSHASMATNDYVEIYTLTASGNVIVHAFSLTVQGNI